MNYSFDQEYIIFNKLYNKDVKSQRTRYWIISGIVGKIKNNSDNINNNINNINNIIRDNEWDINEIKKLINIEKNLINISKYSNEQLKDYVSIYWIEGGLIDGKKIKYSGTLITQGKNIGKKNETNVLSQMISVCNSEYNKKIDKGFNTIINSNMENSNMKNLNLDSQNLTLNSNQASSSKENNIDKEKLFYPMAIHKWNENKEKIIFPAYIQPKLDGVRVLIKQKDNNIINNINNIIIYSRKLKEYIGLDIIKSACSEIFNYFSKIYKNEYVILDGELYNPEINFEKLIGFVRNENDKLLNDIQFYIFDSFRVNNNMQIIPETFENRLNRLDDLFKNLKSLKNSKIIKLVSTIIVNNETDIENNNNIFINEKFEGSVIRNKNGLYLSSTNREMRTYDALKYKLFTDEEYPIKAITQGNKGKEIGAIKFILGLPDGNTFDATPNLTLENRRELYEKYKNPNEFKKIKDKMVTVRYQELTKNNVPRFAKVIAFRDYE